MKSPNPAKKPRQMSAEELAHAAQIGSLLQSAVASAGNTSDASRREAAAFWTDHLAGVIGKHFTQKEH